MVEYQAYYILFTSAIINFLIGLFVLLKNARSLVHWAFFIFVIGISIWSAGIALIFITHLFIFNQIIFYGAMGIFAGLLLFAKVFPDGKTPQHSFWLLFLPFLGIALAIPFNVFVKGIEVSGGTIKPINGPAMPLFIAIAFAYFFYSMALLAKRYRRTSGLARIQMQYLFLGISIVTLSGLLFDGIFPFFGIFDFILLGPLSSIIFVGLTAYAIVRYQLMDIRVLIQSSLVFSMLIVVITSVFTFSALVLSQVLSGIWVFLLPAALIALFMKPLEDFLARVTDHIFFQQRHAPEEMLRVLGAVLMSTIHLDQLLPSFLEKFADFFHTSKGAIVLLAKEDHYVSRQEFGLGVAPLRLEKKSILPQYFGNHSQEIIDRGTLEAVFARELFANDFRAEVLAEMKKLDFYVAVPLAVKQKLIGILFLGQKKSREPFTAQELGLFSSLAHQAAMVIENARLYEEERSLLERLKVADRAKSEFINIVAHQFRTPLSAIRWNLDLLAEALVEGRTEERTRFLDAIRESARFLNNTLENIFDVLIIEGEQLALEPQAVQPWEIVEEVLDDMRSFSIARNVSIIFEKEHIPLREIHADPKKLSRVFVILVQNAIEYNRDGGTIEVTIKESEEQGIGGITVAVEDTGIGILERDRDRVFSKFFRGENAQRISPNGTGLGLFIAKHIIEAHRGTIHIAPRVGDGTAISVFLPFAGSLAPKAL